VVPKAYQLLLTFIIAGSGKFSGIAGLLVTRLTGTAKATFSCKATDSKLDHEECILAIGASIARPKQGDSDPEVSSWTKNTKLEGRFGL
jgi:hypothetical protein